MAGVVQGSIVLPFLFNVLHQWPPQCFGYTRASYCFGTLQTPQPALIFTDDVAALTHDASVLQHTLVIASQWAKNNHMTIGIKKYGIIYPTCVPWFTLQGKEIPKVLFMTTLTLFLTIQAWLPLHNSSNILARGQQQSIILLTLACTQQQLVFSFMWKMTCSYYSHSLGKWPLYYH